jgi:hypothetical protein
VPVIASGKRGIAFRLAGNQEKGPRINLQFSRVLTISAADFSLIANGRPRVGRISPGSEHGQEALFRARVDNGEHLVFRPGRTAI